MAGEYQRSSLRDREALRLEQRTEADIAAIEAAKVPGELEHLSSKPERMVDRAAKRRQVSFPCSSSQVFSTTVRLSSPPEH